MYVSTYVFILLYRAIGSCGNPGMPVLFGGHNLPPLVEMELTDLPNSWTLLTKCDLGKTQILSIASKLTEHVIYIYTSGLNSRIRDVCSPKNSP